MFRTSIVHLQECSYAVCCNLVCLDTLWGWRKNCSSSFTLITTVRTETYQIATYSIRTLLKMDYWSPKHVELLNVMNKINDQILCILLDYMYIIKLSEKLSSGRCVSSLQLLLCYNVWCQWRKHENMLCYFWTTVPFKLSIWVVQVILTGTFMCSARTLR